MADLVVGIDGGGTKTRVECYDAQDLRQVGVGEGGACNIAAISVAQALASVAAAFAGAEVDLSSAIAVCAAIAGYSHEARRAEFKLALSRLLPNAVVSVAPDYEAAFRSALPQGSGALVIAGTGSIAYADNGAGLSARVGGYGYLIDDAGSGYGVGRQALAAILSARDGLGEPTLLAECSARLLGWSSNEMQRDAIIREVYFGSLDRTRIASLSQAVAEAADAGDPVAGRILMHAGGALARLADAVIRQAFQASSEPVLVARAGSLWRAGSALTDVFERSLARFAPHSALTEAAANEPAWGAAQMAFDLLNRQQRA